MAQQNLTPRTTQDDPTSSPNLHSLSHLPPVNVAAVLRAVQARLTAESTLDITIEVDESVHVPADAEALSAAVYALLRQASELAPGQRVFLRGRALEPGVAVEVEIDGGGESWAHDRAPWPHRLATVKSIVEPMGGEAHWTIGADRIGAFVLLFRAPVLRPPTHRRVLRELVTS